MQPPPGEILFEFWRLGAYVKVSAIHVETDTEVCLVGDPRMGTYGLRLAVTRKLAHVMAANAAKARSLALFA